MSTHPFDEAVALAAQGEHRWHGQTSPAYANMVGPFGGITAAQMLAAVLAHPQRLGEPASLTVNFAAAIADGPFEIEARPVRTNRSTQHWVAELRQNGEIATTATAFTAVRRDTWGADDIAMPAAPRPDSVQRPDMGGRVEWINRYDMRFVEGFFPPAWDGAEHDSLTRLWVRDEPPRALDFAALAALCDVFYPRIWRRRARMVPAGTVSMTVYFHASAAHLREASGHLLAQARAQTFHDGYFDQTAQIWSEAGTLLATSNQIVYYKE